MALLGILGIYGIIGTYGIYGKCPGSSYNTTFPAKNSRVRGQIYKEFKITVSDEFIVSLF